MIRSIVNRINYLQALIINSFSQDKIEDNKVFVYTFDKNYSCNPKYIIEELIQRDNQVKIVWVVDDNNNLELFPNNIKLVKENSKEMFIEMLSSKVWIDNALNCIWINTKKNKKQTYINTWHGSFGIKKTTGNKRWLQVAKRSKLVDYCITHSTYEERIFKDTYWKNVTTLNYGHPRNDVFFRNEKEKNKIISKVKNKYGLKDEKILLFAPTFRDDGSIGIPSDNEFLQIKAALKQRFNDDWVILFRFHNKNKTYQNDRNEIINVSDYVDIQELLIACDAGVSDYSSWIFDFLLSNKPAFIYAPDLKEYEEKRGFYYPIYETPFSISKSIDELISNICKFNQASYIDKVKNFLNEKGNYEKGNASKQSVDFIIKQLDKENNDIQ